MRKNRKKILLASSVAIVCAANAPAGQITQVCSTGNTVIASYTSGSTSTGVSPNTCYTVSLAQASTAAAKKDKYSGTIYSRGQPFSLSSASVPSSYSFAAYDRLAPCLLKCPNSMSAATAKAIADKRKASTTAKKTTQSTTTAANSDVHKDNAGGTGSNADQSDVHGTTSTADAGSKTNTNTNANASTYTNPSFGNFWKNQKEQTTFDTTNPNDQAALTDTVLRGSGQISIDKKIFNKTADGQFEDPITGAWSRWDPSTNKLVESHSPTEYVGGDGHVYHSLADARAVGLDSDPKAVVNHYDKNGTKTTVSLADAHKNAEQAIKERGKQAKADRKNGDKKDDCEASYEWAKENDKDNAEKYRCSVTNTIAKAADVSNQVLTGAGRAVVNTLGATAAQNASQGGTFIDAQKATAKMAKTAFTYETALGGANVVAAAVLAKKASQHKNAYNTLKDYTLDEKAKAKLKSDYGGLYDGSDEQAAVEAAKKEQARARDIASIQAFKSAMVAAQSAAAAIVAKNNQKAAEKNAALARQAANTISNNTFGFDPNSLAPAQQPPQFDPNAMAASGSTESGGAATTTDNVDPNAPTGALLGDGNDLSGGDDSLNAPKAGAFKEGTTAGGPGGGGAPGAGASGGGGGGGTPTAQDESKAAYASEFGTKERYESGGGTGYAPKAGGAGAAKGGDGGIDLNGLLAQFLPKADDESAKHSILDSVAFGGNRHIATEEPASYLDKNADLFQRIHETMSEKNRRGQLGI